MSYHTYLRLLPSQLLSVSLLLLQLVCFLSGCQVGESSSISCAVSDWTQSAVHVTAEHAQQTGLFTWMHPRHPAGIFLCRRGRHREAAEQKEIHPRAEECLEGARFTASSSPGACLTRELPPKSGLAYIRVHAETSSRPWSSQNSTCALGARASLRMTRWRWWR